MILPAEFEKRMRLQLADDYDNFVNALLQDAPISIRLNPHKIDVQLDLEKVAWCSNAYYLNERPIFSSDPLWHNGSYYVQEASSMMIEAAFNSIKSLLNQPLVVLDACAAPGGKSTHIANLLGEKDVLVSNEVIKSRVPVLFENITKNGYFNSIITNADTSDFTKVGAIFDVIVIDAPCSGEGLFRKDEQATNEWNLENVNTCELRQKRILENLIKCVKPGGFIIYSTCTYNPGENEQQVKYLLDNGFQLMPFNIKNQNYSQYQCFPHQIKGEGFFIALLQNQNELPSFAKKPNTLLKPLTVEQEWSNLLLGDFKYYKYNDSILAIKPHVYELYSNYLSSIYTYSIGVEIGHQKEKLITLSSYLPFSRILNKAAFQTFELDLNQALSYFNRNAILVNERDKKGYVLLTYKNSIVGLGKYAGNRINNLFPNEWKLRKIPLQNEVFSILK